MNDDRRFPNLFWPVIFIGVGGLILLANMGLIDPINLGEVWRLWPIFLVVAGVNMLFGRNNRLFASMFSGLLALAVIAFLYFAPSVIDTLPGPELVTESFSDPSTGVQEAEVSIDFDRGNIFIEGLEESDPLFEAMVTHDERVTFNASGSSTRNIRLRLDQVSTVPFGSFFDQAQIEAQIGLAPGVPIALDVNIGGGSAEMDLGGLTLKKVKADSGSGSLEAVLPGGDYKVDFSSGSGSISVETGEDSELDMKLDVGSGRITVVLAEGNYGELNLDSGSGSITIIVPEGVAVLLRGDTGSGSVTVPSDFQQTSGDNRFSGDGGEWQTVGLDEAEEYLLIRFDVGSGSIRVKHP
jgi:hypothetical protein